jgi:type II secretory ATPase GspE/PulE/Tfp pilus assembly ATPase PilB-like protein
MKNFDRILKDALVKNNVLSEADIKTYALDAQTSSLPLKAYLIENSIVTEKQVTIAISQFLNLEMADLTKIEVDPEVITKVPVKFAWYYQIMPLYFENETIVLAAEMPPDVRVQDEIRIHLGMPVKIVLTEGRALKDALRKYYGFAAETVDKMISKEKSPEIDQEESGLQWVEDIERETEDPTVSNLVNQIILEAYKKRATDIHIEPYRDKVRLRYRIDGVLVDAHLADNIRPFLPQIVSRIKILANLSITEKRLPQDGSASVKTKEQQLDLRISTIPTPWGESMVVRILPTKVILLSLEKLGFSAEGVAHFRDLIKIPHGVIFITGPTGSGKTTTLYACLNEINSPEHKIITVEDPVEYEMQGITQVQVNHRLNFSFATGLRSLLRHDPDIIMVGEVRDTETAEITIRTALTGHLVFSTLHTNDASSGITRLIDMGIEPYLVASSVEAFVAQRLVRLLCPRCKVEDKDVSNTIRQEIIGSLGLDSAKDIRVWRGKGCDHCNGTGYYGRKAIFEILRVDEDVRAAILKKARPDHIKQMAVIKGMRTLRQNGWQSVLDGETTPEEIMNVSVPDRDINTESAVPARCKSMGALRPVEERPAKPVRIQRSNWDMTNRYEARIYPRVYANIEIRYRIMRPDPNDENFLISDGMEYITATEDISAGGLRFIADGFLPIGSILEVKIYLDKQTPPIVSLAKVCRVEEDHLEHVYTMVNYYLDLSSSDRVAISKFVQDHLHCNAASPDQDIEKDLGGK